MNIAETISKLKEIGMIGNVVRTGHDDYKRIFVRDAEGITYGRITIFRGQYDHIKWYHESLFDLRCPFLLSEKAAMSWSLLMSGSRPVTDDEWSIAIKKAKALVEEEYQQRVAARELLPKKKRKSLKKRNFRRYLPDLIREMRA